MALPSPTILFVPGAWHQPSCFDEVLSRLGQLGFNTMAIANPSVGSFASSKMLIDDVSNLRSVIEGIADKGGPVVLVAHSYGGVVASSAAEGLGLAQRSLLGKEGGIMMIVYLAAFITPAGVSLLEAVGGTAPLWWEYQGDLLYANDPAISDPADRFYNDLPESAQNYWISQLRPLSGAAVTTPATYEPWEHIPCIYIFAQQDHAVPLSAQQAMASQLGDITTATLNSSHSPFLSMPEKVAEVVQVAVKEGLEKAKSQ